MKTKIINANIVKDFDSDIVFGDIMIENGKIVYVGKSTDLTADCVIDANNKLVMPGFVNAFAKSSSVIFKGLLTEKRFEDKLYQQKKYERKLCADDFYNSTALSCCEYAKNGITTVFDCSSFVDQSAKAFSDFGIRVVVGLSQRYSADVFLSDTDIQKLAEKINQSNKNIKLGFACGDVNSCDEEMFDICQKLANKNNTFAFASACATLDEVGRCATLNGDMSPVELLEDYGFFDHKAMVAHLTNITQRDVQILAKNGVSACACVSTDFASANGTAPIYQLKNNGINVCLGTCYASISGKQDMFKEMFLALAGQNNLLGGRELSAKDILKMATTNGAKALNLENVGTLNEGYFADLIMIDTNSTNNAVQNDIFENLVTCCGVEDIVLTMVGGKIIYQKDDRIFLKIQEKVLEKIKEIQNKLK